ncbi:MAG: ferritin-like domain-containing protein [Gemmatimonadota bacterium]|nr:ferritin-like domain-containing protein [Gemmatimonadota bacterium]
MPDKKTMLVSRAEQLSDPATRRDFLKIMGIGGAIVFLPTVLTSCKDSTNSITGPGTGNTLTIDFSKGDTAVLQFAYALEQLEADFYTRVVAAFSGFPAADQAVLADVQKHEVVHREFLKAALGATNGFTVTTTYGGLDFTNRTAVLALAATFEDLGVAAYNGAAQYITSTDNLTIAGKIVSVEARHASAIHDLIAPKTNAFAPQSFDDAFRPAKVATAAQAYIVDHLALANAPSAFVQGPNGNG